MDWIISDMWVIKIYIHFGLDSSNAARIRFYHLSQSLPPSQSCTSSPNNLTSSPGLNAGRPIYGQPSHRKASPSAQLPQLPTFPLTVKSTSARSSACSLARFWSAEARLARSSASSRWARPQVQSLQARRRFLLPAGGRQEGAVVPGRARS